MANHRTPPGAADDEPDWHMLLEKLADIESRLDQLPQAPPSSRLSDKKLAVIASSVYRTRRRRPKYFDRSLFGEPAWDMLLDLFANAALGRQVNVTSLCLAANVPQSTALRYITLLEENGLIERCASPEDGRVMLVDLSTTGYRQMRRYLVDGLSRFELPRPE
jgi:DNA-binding MarR family transcriptional regulator